MARAPGRHCQLSGCASPAAAPSPSGQSWSSCARFPSNYWLLDRRRWCTHRHASNPWATRCRAHRGRGAERPSRERRTGARPRCSPLTVGPTSAGCGPWSAAAPPRIFTRSHPDDGDEPGSVLWTVFGGPASTHRELEWLAGPLTHVRPGVPPYLLFHGTDDETVPYQQTATLAQLLGGRRRGHRSHGPRWPTQHAGRP